MENYIILHGSFGSPQGNWFMWLKEILLREWKAVDVPALPVGVGKQNFESWSEVLDNLDVNSNTTIIAHSSAPVFVCKYLITKKIKVKKLIFVCGFNNYFGINEEYDAVNKPMYIDNLEDVKKYCNDIVCFYSDNDPYVKYEVEKEFAENLTNNTMVIPGGGHLNEEAGYKRFYELLPYLDLKKVRYATRVFVFNEDKVLCIKYKNTNNKYLDNYIDIPGGKIEPGESAVDGAIREVQEETGCTIKDIELVGNLNIEYKEKLFIMKVYKASVEINSLKRNENTDEAIWLNREEIKNYDWKLPSMYLTNQLDVFKKKNLNMTLVCKDNHEIIKVINDTEV